MREGTHDVPLERVLAVARRTGLSAAATLFVALAEEQRSKLLTRDRRIPERCPDGAVAPR